MAEDPVVISRHIPGVSVISINRPHRRNAVDLATSEKLYAALCDFDNDSSQQVAILTGTGGTFCAGYDLHSVSSTPHPEDAPVTSQSRAPMGPSRLRLSKPLIAAVAGYAVAGGLELSLLADIRVVEEGTVFGVFCRRFGVPLIDGGTVRLQRIVGFGRAMDMILTGRPVDAVEAKEFGLANYVVPRGHALQRATELALGLLQFPQMCMRSDRASAYHAAFDATSFEDAMAFEFREGRKVLQSESVPGAARFSRGEGRHGDFHNKAQENL